MTARFLLWGEQDAPWSRISYDEVPFEEIYTLVKSLQPNCLLMDLNSAKYPPDFPTSPVKDPKTLVGEDIIPYNKIYDNFILNEAPVISRNLAERQPANASWSDDMNIMDFGNEPGVSDERRN